LVGCRGATGRRAPGEAGVLEPIRLREKPLHRILVVSSANGAAGLQPFEQKALGRTLLGPVESESFRASGVDPGAHNCRTRLFYLSYEAPLFGACDLTGPTQRLANEQTIRRAQRGEVGATTLRPRSLRSSSEDKWPAQTALSNRRQREGRTQCSSEEKMEGRVGTRAGPRKKPDSTSGIDRSGRPSRPIRRRPTRCPCRGSQNEKPKLTSHSRPGAWASRPRPQACRLRILSTLAAPYARAKQRRHEGRSDPSRRIRPRSSWTRQETSVPRTNGDTQGTGRPVYLVPCGKIQKFAEVN